MNMRVMKLVSIVMFIVRLGIFNVCCIMCKAESWESVLPLFKFLQCIGCWPLVKFERKCAISAEKRAWLRMRNVYFVLCYGICCGTVFFASTPLVLKAAKEEALYNKINYCLDFFSFSVFAVGVPLTTLCQMTRAISLAKCLQKLDFVFSTTKEEQASNWRRCYFIFFTLTYLVIINAGISFAFRDFLSNYFTDLLWIYVGCPTYGFMFVYPAAIQLLFVHLSFIVAQKFAAMAECGKHTFRDLTDEKCVSEPANSFRSCLLLKQIDSKTSLCGKLDLMRLTYFEIEHSFARLQNLFSVLFSFIVPCQVFQTLANGVLVVKLLSTTPVLERDSFSFSGSLVFALCQCFHNVILISSICWAADNLAATSLEFREVILGRCSSHFTPKELAIIQSIKHCCPQIPFNAAGLFNISRTLLPSVAGTLITYFVFFWQTIPPVKL